MYKAMGFVALLIAGQAHATTYKATLTGTLTEQTSDGEPSPYFVGSKIELTARFDTKYTVETPFGYSLAGLYAGTVPNAPDPSLLITSAGGDWGAGSDEADGYGGFYSYDYYVEDINGAITSRHYTLASPGIAFANGKVLGVTGSLVPVSNPTPVLRLGSGFFGSTDCYNIERGDPVMCTTTWHSSSLSAHFGLGGDKGLYSNQYLGPEFDGVWDFANSSVVAVPEPYTWSLMIVGFTGVGTAARRRRRRWATPSAAKPAIMKAQVAGSGTAPVANRPLISRLS